MKEVQLYSDTTRGQCFVCVCVCVCVCVWVDGWMLRRLIPAPWICSIDQGQSMNISGQIYPDHPRPLNMAVKKSLKRSSHRAKVQHILKAGRNTLFFLRKFQGFPLWDWVGASNTSSL